MTRNNNKSLDLSRSLRLTGLASGAKLELVQSSRSPAVVSVALQLPESEVHGTQASRLTEKFPSSTTLWLILRRFESAASGDPEQTRNFTARGAPKTQGGNSGAGRLYYETPVIQAMGRELTSFTDLQKTLRQLGFNSGSALLRLSFRTTDQPLEEAVEQIGQFFKSTEDQDSKTDQARSASTIQSIPAHPVPISSKSEAESPSPPEPMNSSPKKKLSDEETAPPAAQAESPLITSPGRRPTTVFAPPSSSTPSATRQPHNEADFELTKEQALQHQARLVQAGRNTRLPTDAEIAAKEELQRQKSASIKEIEIKVRFPDQMQVVSTFSNTDTASTLYDYVRGLLEHESAPFLLNFLSPKGPKVVPRGAGAGLTATERLIPDLGMTGRTLVNFLWDDSASAEVRSSNVLKAHYRDTAREIDIPPIQPVGDDELPGGGEAQAGAALDERTGTGMGRKGNGMGKGPPKWFKGFGKK